MFEKKVLERVQGSLILTVWMADKTGKTGIGYLGLTLRPTTAEYMEVAHIPLSYQDAEWLADCLTRFTTLGRAVNEGGDDVSKSNEDGN